jgi:transposase
MVETKNFPQILAEKEQEITALRQQVDWLTDQLKLAGRRQFGASSEKTPPDQLSLFNEAEALADPAAPEPEVEEIKSYCRRRAGQVGTDRLPEDLPVEVIEHDIPAAQRACPCCGEEMRGIGCETREELKLIPAKAVLLRHVSHTYACGHCNRNAEKTPVVKAPMPKPVIKGSFASPEAIAHIACEKYVMGSPLYRQEADWERKGIPLSRQTMANWLIRATNDWLLPIYSVMQAELRRRQVLHADESELQVLREDGRAAHNKSYMWVYRTSGDAEHAIVLYDYQPSRSGDCAKNFLGDFQGYLHTDGHSGYRAKLPDTVTIVGCWAHARRRFNDALQVIPAKSRKGSPAAEAMRQLGQIYKLEEEFAEYSPEDRYEARQTHTKPLLETLFAWCAKQTALPKSVLGKAIKYCLEQRFWLEHFLLDGRLEIDNNRAERSVKPYVIGRKNWLFSNTPAGARTTAMLYSIIETAKENQIDPFSYLAFIFHNAPNWDIQNHPEAIEQLLPWRYDNTSVLPVAC